MFVPKSLLKRKKRSSIIGVYIGYVIKPSQDRYLYMYAYSYNLNICRQCQNAIKSISLLTKIRISALNYLGES